MHHRVARAAAAAAETAAAQAEAASRLKLRRYILTGGVAAIVCFGSIYGAGLKIQGEVKSELTARAEAPIDEQIAILEERKQYLIGQRTPFERKLVLLNDRIAARQENQQKEQGTVVNPDTRPAQKRDLAADASSAASPSKDGTAETSKITSRWWW